MYLDQFLLVSRRLKQNNNLNSTFFYYNQKEFGTVNDIRILSTHDKMCRLRFFSLFSVLGTKGLKCYWVTDIIICFVSKLILNTVHKWNIINSLLNGSKVWKTNRFILLARVQRKFTFRFNNSSSHVLELFKYPCI